MKMFHDLRGWSGEVYQGLYNSEYRIDYWSYSRERTIRGLHYRKPAQRGLLTVLVGRIFDVMVDLKTGVWQGVELNAGEQIEIPKGMAHGFCVTSPWAGVLYKLSEYWEPDCEFGIAWNDPDLAITWPTDNPILSKRDTQWPTLSSLALVAT